jgi:lysine-specific demethylase 8
LYLRRRDVILPPPLRCGGYVAQLADTVIWFSNGGTKTILHHDDVENINCVYSGRKEVLMIEYPKYKDKVRLVGDGYSSVDVDRVDFTEFPELLDVEYQLAHVEEGDCFFLPYKWFHVIRSYGRNLAVNVWYTPLIDFNTTDCNNVPKDFKSPSLDSLTFHSMDGPYTAQEKPSSQGPPDDLRVYFSEMLGEYNVLTLQSLIEHLQKDKTLMRPGIHWTEAMNDIAYQFFSVLDTDSDGIVTADNIADVDEATHVILEHIAEQMENILDEQISAKERIFEKRPYSDRAAAASTVSDKEEL